MDWAMLRVTAVASVAAVASAIVAVVQARAAKASERDAVDARNESRAARDESVRLASEANAAFVRQAEAQEQANALREAAMRPPVWSGPRWISGDMYALTNSSGRTVEVATIEVEPDEAEKWVRVYGPEDGIYKYGDSLEFMASNAWGIRAQKLTLHWRYEDEPDDAVRAFIVSL
jgi:hypothetical protein